MSTLERNSKPFYTKKLKIETFPSLFVFLVTFSQQDLNQKIEYCNMSIVCTLHYTRSKYVIKIDPNN